ncbi:glycosyltransferase family 2 protein [Salinibacter sp.]|uniref:glycosyltransferase family 2 protein n=1 Tax=Salinibacter sp. TaxID=2065818 RepID=UPI0021E7DFBB|nr:glycosyltransferase family 2 protein [Salinibacter sp.]
MNSPDISVVLPVYNGKKYLDESVSSVLSQTFETFELVICDDASQDTSRDLIARYDDPRIRVLANDQNRGLFPTLNRLLRASRTPLIRLWSQDDRMKPRCLEVEADFWAKHPDLGMSFCLRDHIDADGNTTWTAPQDRSSSVLSPRHMVQSSFYHGSPPGNISTVMLNREALRTVGPFRPDMTYSGDFELWVRLSKQHETGVIAQSLVDLRFHAGQLSRQNVMLSKIREDQEVVRRLLERLPDHLQGHARIYNRWHRHVRYAHHMMKSALKGRWHEAAQTFRLLHNVDSPGWVLLLWLISANGRWFKPEPKFDL